MTAPYQVNVPQSSGTITLRADGALVATYTVTAGICTGIASINDVKAILSGVAGSTVTDSNTLADLAGAGAAPASVPGRELAATVLTSSPAGFANTATWVDIPGLSIAPIIGSRGIYVDLTVSSYSSVIANQLFRLYDVTAGAVADGGRGLIVVNSIANQCFTNSVRWRLAPPPGQRTYKVQTSTASNNTTTIGGPDVGGSTALYCTER